MDEVIDLTDIDYLMQPYCSTCDEKTKRITARTFDLEGPGQVGTLYDCKNKQCKRIKDLKARYLLRSEVV